MSNVNLFTTIYVDNYIEGEYYIKTEIPSIGGKLYLRITNTPTKDVTKKKYYDRQRKITCIPIKCTSL